MPTMPRQPLTVAPGATQAAFLAQVVSLDDPENRGRVQIHLLSFTGTEGQDSTIWARVVSAFAGNDRGVFFLPDVNDEVLVMFEQGDPRHPLVIGGLWNGSAQPPAQVEAGGRNRIKRIRSKNGVVVTLDDQDGQEALRLETPGGQKLTLQDGPGSVKIEDGNGNSVTLEAAGITVQASRKVTVTATSVEVTAGTVKVDAAMSTFSGMVKCDILQTNVVISSSYTPGAGNVW